MSDTNYKKAFDIGRIPKNIDLSSPPVTGFDYLYRVRLETRKCPKVVVSDMDTTRFLSRQTVLVDPFNGFVRARPGFEPDPALQDEQIETFCSTRRDLFQNREEMKKLFPKKDFPKITNEEDWCRFCLGSKLHGEIFPSEESTSASDAEPKSKKSRPEADDSTHSESGSTLQQAEQPKSKKSHPETDDSTHSESGNTLRQAQQPKSKKFRFDSTHSESGNPPLLSIVLYLNQTRVTRLLAYQVGWLENGGYSDVQGRWLYALLVCLEKPLDPDTCALLRSLARICSKLRGGLANPKDSLVTSINLILSIISRFFDQKDMSDCFSMD